MLKSVNKLIITNNINWMEVSKSYNLVENISFVEKYKSKLDWHFITLFQPLTEAFIIRYKNRIYWNILPHGNIQLSEEFIEKYSEQLDWTLLIIKQKLSESFILKHSDRINWEALPYYQNLSEEFIIDNLDKFNIDVLRIKKQIPETSHNYPILLLNSI